jgi:hypothetical protein
MTKHLYFTDYTKALYMMKAFGVTFDNEVNEWFYVAPESYHIFEQKEGDIGIQVTKESRDDGGYLAIAWACEYEDFVEFNETISPSKYWKIIMRDNKLFFQPETE